MMALYRHVKEMQYLLMQSNKFTTKAFNIPISRLEN